MTFSAARTAGIQAAARSREAAGFVLGLSAVAALGAANGGYFPKSWGVAGLLLIWLAGLLVAVQRAYALERLDAMFLGALALLAAWIAMSLGWTASVPQTVFELQRALVFVAWAAAVLLLVRRGSVTWLVGGLVAGVTALSLDALVARLFQDVFGPPAPRFFDAGALSGRVGYSNALGSLAALGLLLALGFSLRGTRAVVRAAAAAALVLLLCTLYLTLSRGAWLGLAVGLLLGLGLDPARRSLALPLLVLTPVAAGTVAAAASAPALVRATAGTEAVPQGHRLAGLVAGLALAAAALAAFVFPRLPELRVPRRANLLSAPALAAVAVVLLVRAGGPADAVTSVREAFTAPAARGGPTDRLLSASGTRRHHFWRAAWEAGRERPVAGGGAGTFESYWFEHRTVRTNVRDAHNLYLETFAELGAVGLAILLVVLGIPIAAAVRARGSPLVPAAAGGYAVWVVHTGVDWMWEMTAVTTAALGCGAALVVWARPQRVARRAPSPFARGAGLACALALGAVAFVGLVGNSALAASEDALYAGRPDRAAEHASRAARWAPWASEPHRLLAEARLAQGRRAEAAAAARAGLERDPGSWLLWYDLALTSSGEERRHAVAEARRLNPKSFRVLALE